VANYELIYKQQEEKSKYQDEIEDAINSGSPLINALAET
jgi:hypothetical protein